MGQLEAADRMAAGRAWSGILAGALLLCWPAVLNGYPLVFADTGNYLAQALQLFVGWNAPPFYSFFLLATDWRLSLWPPVLVQAGIVAHLIWLVLRQFGWAGKLPVLAACALLAATTSLPWFASLLTTDVFTGVVVLASWLLGFGVLGRWERRYLWLLAIGAVSVHLSHVPLGFGLALLGGVLAAAAAGRRAGLAAFARMVVAPATAALLLILVNLVAHRTPTLAPYGSVVAAARMLGDRTAQAYLATACPVRHFRICPYLDQVGAGGNEFLWHRDLIARDLGGAEGWAPEAGAIVRGTILNQPRAVAAAAFGNTFHLFGHLWLRDVLTPWPGTPGPAPVIARFFPARELRAYRASLQSAGRMPALAGTGAPVQLACAWAGLAALVWLVATTWRERVGWTFCALVLAAVLANAFLTASLSGVEDRYESRVAWLMAFAPAAVLAARAAGQLAACGASSASSARNRSTTAPGPAPP